MKTTVRRPSLRELRAETDEGVLRLALMVWPELRYISDERRSEPYRHRNLNRSKYVIPHQGDRERMRRMLQKPIHQWDFAFANEVMKRRADRIDTPPLARAA